MLKALKFFLRGQRWFKILKKISLKKCHEAHQIDQRNVLNAKMYVVGGKNPFSFQRSKVGKIGQNWPAEFCHQGVSREGGGSGWR